MRVVAILTSVDIPSATGSNLFGIRKECKEELDWKPVARVKHLILDVKSRVPESDSWRVGCLKNYMEVRHQLLARLEDTSNIDSIIDSLYSS